ncbi:MAG: methylated-DNA--[protein]-cysteine S-methyltransferase [Gemmatimonadota bacterium]|nr:methylated-DNA--[protein]-cysteine S-methyltransferase [Gemmatimonadota bacterium]
MFFLTIPSPVGELTLAAHERGLVAVYFAEHKHAPEPTARRPWLPDDGANSASPTLRAAREQLTAYFAGERTAFDLPLAPEGTPFQQTVWAELRRIPFGELTSYGALARRLGNPNATRAVGAANGRNPLSIVVPCHRVVGADGSLTGFGGGIERKRWLIAHEARVSARR